MTKKITYTEKRGMDNEANITQDVDVYIKSKLTPSPWQYDTYERRLAAESENVMEALIRLLTHMCDSGSMSAQQLAGVVGDSGDVAFEGKVDTKELKVGDKVVVDLSGWKVGDGCTESGIHLVKEMFDYYGHGARVTHSTEHGAHILNVDDGDYTWSPKWLRKC